MSNFGKRKCINANTQCVKIRFFLDVARQTKLNMYKSMDRKGENAMYKQQGKKYIYSVIQANEFIHRGYRCIETGFNSKQRKYFWVFNYDEVQEYYKTSERYK